MYMAMLNNQRVTLVISTMNHSIHEPFNSPPRRHSLDRINKCLPYNVQSHQPDIARWHISTVSSPSETLCEIVWSCSPSSGSTGHIPWWDYPMIVWLSPLREKTTWWNIMMVFQVQSQVVCMCIYIYMGPLIITMIQHCENRSQRLLLMVHFHSKLKPFASYRCYFKLYMGW